MPKRVEHDWLQGRASLGMVAGWTPDEMRLVADLGYALAEQGRNQEAIIVFEGLAALAPATAYFQTALGALWLRMEEPKRAIAHLNAAIKADPQDIMALVNRGESYMQLGDRTAAIRDLTAAVRLGEQISAAGLELCLARASALLAHLEELSDQTGS